MKSTGNKTSLETNCPKLFSKLLKNKLRYDHEDANERKNLHDE